MTPLRQRFLVAGICALLFTAILNFQSLLLWSRGDLTVASLSEHAIDERYYIGTIGKVGNGAAVMGHASYYEHRDDAPSASLAPAIEGLVMRWLHLSLPVALLLCDILFPFLAVFLLALGLPSIAGGSVLIAGFIAVIIGSDIGTYWFRSSNPQLPFIGVMAWLAVVFAWPLSSRKSLVLRGIIVGLLSWVQLVYASFFVIADGVLMIAEALRTRSIKRVLPGAFLYGVALLVCLLPRFFLHLSPEVATDTFYRLGIIHSHAPADPKTQLLLLLVLIGIGLYSWWEKAWPSEAVRRCYLLLIAALIGLNQAIIHGIDATFVSYYQPAIRIILFLTLLGLLSSFLRSLRTRQLVFALITGFSLGSLVFSVYTIKAQTSAETMHLEQSDVPAVLEWLRQQPGILVVAAPNVLNERIPGETQHYVLFNEYGWNQPVSDTELAERYALQVRLIPSSKARDNTYTFVFGGHAGLQAAKERTLCRIKRSLFHSSDDCNIQARSLIRHQELLPVVDDLKVNVEEAMAKFHVGSVITEDEDKGVIPAQCKQDRKIGTFTVWSCQ